MAFVVREYVEDSGRIPFRDWLVELDKATRARVQARILRFETGNLGDHKDVGAGVLEARLDFGPGLPGVLWTEGTRAGPAPVGW